MAAYILLEKAGFTYKKTGFGLKGISLELRLGETAMITGSNGSGKSTLAKLIMGIIKADSGGILIDGQDVLKMSLAAVAKKIGYLFQNPERQIFCNSVLEEIEFSLIHGCGADADTARNEARRLLKLFSMQDMEEAFPLKLSRGEKQRLALMAVFAVRPKYYILDEPSSGIDKVSKQSLKDMLAELKRQGAGICIITHDRELIAHIADRVINMSDGRIISDENTGS